MKTLSFNVSYNYFGDTVLTESNEDKSYNMFQYNCMNAKNLLKRVKDAVNSGITVFVIEVDDLFGAKVFDAISYIQDIIDLNDRVNDIRASSNFSDTNSAGAEIAGRYGY
jgi:hypothetical protein